MKKIIIPILLMSGASLGAGFATTSFAEKEADSQPAQSWGIIPLPIDYSESSNRFLADLVATGAFPISELKSNSMDSANALTGTKPRPTFPTVIAIGILDGVHTAQIVMRDGELRTVRQGDTLINDWSVKTIDMHKMVISNSMEDISIEF